MNLKVLSNIKLNIKNLKYAHLTPVLRLHNIIFRILYRPTQIQMGIMTKKMSLKAIINTYLKAKNSLNTTRISSLK